MHQKQMDTLGSNNIIIQIKLIRPSTNCILAKLGCYNQALVIILFHLLYYNMEKLRKQGNQSANYGEIFREKVNNFNQQLHEEKEAKKLQRFVEVLARQPSEYEDVRALAWGGIPQFIRAKIWKYLLKYRLKSTDILEKKRNQYKNYVAKYLPVYNFELIESENDRKIAKVIEGDIKRTLPQAKLTKNLKAQTILTRCLYIWHIKHPASGYVQGINDLVVPYFLTFLSEYKPILFQDLEQEAGLEQLCEETLHYVEADIYWCISKMLEYVTSNYVRGFGGIQQASKNIDNLLKKIDSTLYNHLLNQKIDLFWMSFREISTFLLRMFHPKIGLRLFDTYISYEEKYPIFMEYLLVAIFVKFSNQLKSMKFDEIMKFLQNMPTKGWKQTDLQLVISQAYVYMELYKSV